MTKVTNSIKDQDQLLAHTVDYFHNIYYTISHKLCYLQLALVSRITTTSNSTDLSDLDLRLKDSEIVQANNFFQPFKAPGA